MYRLSPFLGAGAALIGLFLAFLSLRDALFPEKSALAQSIRSQLPYPDEAPGVQELFAMVDRDLKENGQWFGKLGVGREWVLGGPGLLHPPHPGRVQPGGAAYSPLGQAYPGHLPLRNLDRG